jgi:hypothetical protein
MVDTWFANKVKNMSDAELDAQASNAYMVAFYESFGSDHQGRADAVGRYWMLERERKRRQQASGQNR